MLSKRGVSMVLEFQHLLPNAAKGYPPREPRELNSTSRHEFSWTLPLVHLARSASYLAGTPTAEHLAPRQYDFKVKMEVD